MNQKKVSIPFSIISGVVCFILLVLLDQITKKWAVIHLKNQNPLIIVKNVFQLYYLENHGAAFGILQGKRTVFLCVTIFILALIVYCYARIPFERKYRILRSFMVLIAAGAIGNLIDRISIHYVRDFFYFELINFPVFNVADIYVTCAAILLVITILFRYKEEDITELMESIGLKRNDKV